MRRVGRAIFATIVVASTCRPAQAAEGTIYWTTVDTSLRYSDLSLPNSQLLANTPATTQGIAISPSVDLMFFSGKQPDGLYRSRMDGSSIELIVPPCGHTALCSIGTDIEIDLEHAKVYWTESGVDSQYYAIKRSNFDGSDIENVFDFPLTRPASLELDLENNRIYWAEGIVGQQLGRIRRANFDGSDAEDLLTVGVWTPMLEIHPESQKMYWTNNNEGEIWRANLDGTHAEILISGLQNPLGLQIDSLNSKIYWADHHAGVIGRANLDGSHVEDFLVTERFRVQGLALHVIPEPAYVCVLFIASLVVRLSRPRQRRYATF